MMTERDEVMTDRANQPSPSSVYPAMRNTLVTVIALFAVYLAFEFKTLWFREFPEGFYYAGYAHQGAAWLTVALALATVVLSLVFRGSILNDHRLKFLRRLAWIWSAESFVLAIAVYNRLSIYVGFNGLTRMRIVGYFGMTAVVIGFVLVLIKIANNHSFIWLIRRQLWTVAFAIYAYSLTPVDTIAVRYNVRRVLDGDPAPAVQISVQPINAEGLVQLKPLLDAPDETIREGVRALLAERHERAESLAARREEQGWTAFQIADQLALRKLRESKDAWEVYMDPEKRETAISKFRQYVHQWY